MLTLTPRRRRGVEYLDDPATDPDVVHRSMQDVARANAMLGGSRAIVAELRRIVDELPGRTITVLDVGTGLGDIPRRARALEWSRGNPIELVGVDGNEVLVRAAHAPDFPCVRGDARTLPFGTGSVDVVLCSQLLHHFTSGDVGAVLRELDRVAREGVIVGELRRNWLAVAGIWLASYPLAFHPVSRHDGVVSVLRGFTRRELGGLIRQALGVRAEVRHHLGFRITASWRPRGGPK